MPVEERGFEGLEREEEEVVEIALTYAKYMITASPTQTFLQMQGE